MKFCALAQFLLPGKQQLQEDSRKFDVETFVVSWFVV
jgi:hypothetical protein